MSLMTMSGKKTGKRMKNKFIAIVLHLLCLGAGYFYIGQIKKAFLFVITIVLLVIIGFYLELYIDFMILFVELIVLIIFLYSFVDIWKSFPISDEKNLKYSQWYYVLGFMLLWSMFQFFISNKLENFPTRNFVVPVSSMNNTLFKGDWLVGIKNDDLHRGDIAIFRNPITPDLYLAKRVVALEDDEIIYQDKKLFIHFSEGDDYIKKYFPANSIQKIKNRLWVKNPYQLSNPNIIYKSSNQKGIFEYLLYHNDYMKGFHLEELSSSDGSEKKINAFYTKVAKNSFFMMGDNRDNSRDSLLFGSVPKEYVYGIVKKVYFNYKSWSRFNIEVD